MKKKLTTFALAGALVVSASAAQAIPLLQLDIIGGTYVGKPEETTFSDGDSFTLRALLTPKNNITQADLDDLLNDFYYVSAALTPKLAPPGSSLGSFTFAGTEVQVTDGMQYGVPPIESPGVATSDTHDLQDHGIYETYFRQFAFQFVEGQTITAYDAQDYALPEEGDGKIAYYYDFIVDTSQLKDFLDATGAVLRTNEIHFDLYSTETPKNPDKDIIDIYDVKNFAPFSHDAQSYGDDGGGGGGGGTPVPEPGTLFLLGSGLAGMATRLRRKK